MQPRNTPSKTFCVADAINGTSWRTMNSISLHKNQIVIVKGKMRWLQTEYNLFILKIKNKAFIQIWFT